MPPPSKPSIKDSGGSAILHVRVQPRASRNQIFVESDGRIRIAVTAPAVDNQANDALRALLAKRLSTPKRAITLTHGAKSREKTFRIDGISAAEIRQALAG